MNQIAMLLHFPFAVHVKDFLIIDNRCQMMRNHTQDMEHCLQLTVCQTKCSMNGKHGKIHWKNRRKSAEHTHPPLSVMHRKWLTYLWTAKVLIPHSLMSDWMYLDHGQSHHNEPEEVLLAANGGQYSSHVRAWELCTLGWLNHWTLQAS